MGKKKILVVDDNPDILTSIKEGLRALDSDVEVIPAESGEDCLRLLIREKIKPDLIVLDIMLPKMSGWEVYNRIKERIEWKDIPIIFLTARTDQKAKEIGSFLGEDFIEKPFEIEELKARIDRILERKQNQ